MQSQRINFRRITSPKGEDFERLWKIYEECFPIRDERETRSHLLETARCYTKEENGSYVESFILAISINGWIIGGAIFDYVEGKIGDRKVGFGINWYLFIDKKNRTKGLGHMLHKARVKTLREKSLERQSSLDLLLCELNDPEKMKPADRMKDIKVMNPHERLEFFHRIGFRRIEPAFNYIQPQLTEKTHPCGELMLCIMPLRKEFQNKIPTEYLKQLLRLYVWAGFDGISGSDIKGHRNPETDRVCREMERQLEILNRQKKFISLKPLA